MGLKQITPGTGSGGGGTGDPVSDEQLAQIGGVANDAKTIAQSAKTESAAAGQKADAAKTAADGYAAQITTATQKADAAKTAADAASAAASAASGKADGVTGTATDAKSKAEAAQSAAAAAAAKADAAKLTADSLDTRVTAADTKATDAKNAVAAATAAANSAATKADNAKTAADNAAAVAGGYENRIDSLEATEGAYAQQIAEATATANEANAAALNAKATADDLDDAVAAAVTKANTAKSAADAAAVAAAEAKTIANSANTKATDAKTEADALGTQMNTLVNDVAANGVKADNATSAANIATAKANDLAGDVQAAADAADLANDLISDLTGRVVAAEAEIDALQAGGTGGGGPAYDDAAIKARIDALETDNTVNKADIATLKSAAAAAGAAVPMEYISIWGDSRTAQNWNSAGNAATARGYAWWAEALSGRVRLHLKYNFGVSGDSIQQLLDRMTNDTANASGVKPSQVPPSHAALHIGTNSINAENSVASCMFQLNKCIDWLQQRGHTVYVVSEWPRGQTVNAKEVSVLTPAAQKIMLGYAREVRKLARTKKIKVIDVWPFMADPSRTDCRPRPNYLNNDSLHPSIGAGFLTGKLLAEAMRENNAHKLMVAVGTQDLYDATSNKEGALNNNPMLRGTAGTMGAVSGTTPPRAPTGTAPDGWTVSPTAGLTYDTSTVTLTMADGSKRDAFRITVSGTPEAASGSVMLRVPATTRANTSGVWYGKINDGDIIEAWGEIQVNGNHSNFGNVTCNIASSSGALSQSGGVVTGGTGAVTSDLFTGDQQWPTDLKQDYVATVRSPELVVTASHLQFQTEVRAYFLEAGVPVNLTFDILSAGMRKKFPNA